MGHVDLNSLRRRLTDAYSADNPTAQLVIAELGYKLFPDDAWWATQYGSACFAVGRDSDSEHALLKAHPKRDKNRERVEWLLGKVYQHQAL